MWKHTHMAIGDHKFLYKLSILHKTMFESMQFDSESTIADTYIKTAIKILDADYAFVWLRDQTGTSFRAIYTSPSTPYRPVLPRKKGFMDKIFNRRTSLFIPDTSKHLSIRDDAKRYMKSLVAIPIIYKGERYGNLLVCFKRPHEFRQDQKIICNFLGNGLARSLAIQHLTFNLKDFKNRLDKTLDSVFIFHPVSFKIEYANSGAVRLLGFSHKEILQKNFLNILPELEKKYFRKLIMPLLLKRRESLDVETVLRTKKGGRIPVELFLQLTQSLDGSKKFLSIVHDLSAHKAAEKESQKLLKQKDEFFNIASHELKTPVTTIKGFTQVLQDRLKKADRQTTYYMGKISNQIDKLDHLISDMLDISRIETGKFKFEKTNFEIGTLVGRVVEDMRVTISHHPISLRIEGEFNVHADIERIERVLINLITNAAKYSSPGTAIRVSVKETNEHVQIAVEDFGYGISKKDRAKVFNRFFQSSKRKKNTFPGLGLGLHIAEEIIRHHKGEINFKSKPRSHGTIFYFTLPYFKIRRFTNEKSYS